MPCVCFGHMTLAPQVHEVGRRTTLASMLYASPAWWASRPHMTETGWKDLSGFSPEEGSGDAQSIADMANDADERFFRTIVTNPSHVLRQLLPKPKHIMLCSAPPSTWLRAPYEGRTQLHTSYVI